MSIKKVLGKIRGKLLYGSRYSSQTLCRSLKNIGVRIGENVIFYDPPSCVIDTTNPQLLTIGNNVRVTHGVTILTHDYSWSVISGVYGECLGGVAPVRIGNNVFVGINAIILKGVTIGDNVIIGAGSVVTKDIPQNEVWGGNPARKIMTLEEYDYKKRGQSKREAEELVKLMVDNPNISRDYLREYEPLFNDYRDEKIQKLFRDTGYADKCNEFYQRMEREYSDYNEFKVSIMKDAL